MAKFQYILLIDSKVHIDIDSLNYITDKILIYPDKKVWNGHVNVYKRGNIIARFMDTVTNIGWRRYFSNPRDCDYGLEDFDFYPKGTGCFLTTKSILLSAMKEFKLQTNDIRNSSDDTLLIRIIAKKNNINLSPNFSCTYFARNKIRQFIPHTYNRGKFFVDGFLKPGTRFYRPLQVVILLSIFIPISIIIYPVIFLYYVTVLLVIWILELLITLLLGIDFKDALSFWLLTPLFSLFYILGIWYAVINIFKEWIKK